MTEDLAAAVLAAIEQTAHVAEKARDAGANNAYGHTIQEAWVDSDGNISTRPDGVTIVTGPYGLDPAVQAHILRQQPTTVLRRCDADRETVAAYQTAAAAAQVASPSSQLHDVAAGLRIALKNLARTYDITAEETR